MVSDSEGMISKHGFWYLVIFLGLLVACVISVIHQEIQPTPIPTPPPSHTTGR